MMDRATIRNRLAYWANLRENDVLNRSDFDLNPGNRDGWRPKRRRDASVLVPLIDRAEGLRVLLTHRTEHLNDHPGQVAFPGGGREAQDTDDVATALRETEEEIGLQRAHVEVAGTLDPYETVTGYRVTPVVGLVEPGFDLELDPYEVAGVFEVPLAFLMDAENHQLHYRVWNGQKRFFYAMPYDGHYIWGATAGMLVNLYEILTGGVRRMPGDGIEPKEVFI